MKIMEALTNNKIQRMVFVFKKRNGQKARR